MATDECCGKILSLALSKDERAKYENEAFSWIWTHQLQLPVNNLLIAYHLKFDMFTRSGYLSTTNLALLGQSLLNKRQIVVSIHT